MKFCDGLRHIAPYQLITCVDVILSVVSTQLRASRFNPGVIIDVPGCINPTIIHPGIFSSGI